MPNFVHCESASGEMQIVCSLPTLKLFFSLILNKSSAILLHRICHKIEQIYLGLPLNVVSV